jgi:hypothetical protein
MDLPLDIPFDPEQPPDTLPELPPGYTWGLTVTAEAEVVKAKNQNEVTP